MVTHSQYYEEALARLKEAGLRVTQPRKAILKCLDVATIPLNAYDITEVLAKEQVQVDTVTVYRVLECLEEHHLIHRMVGSGKVLKCQLDHEDHCEHQHEAHHCHHLIVCETCKRVEEVHCTALEDLTHSVEQSTGYAVAYHSLEFYGKCPQCQAK